MAYCTRADIELILGKAGTDLRLDDQGNTSNAINRCISYAEGRMNRYLAQVYDTSTLEGNAWVRDRCALIAANILSQRRGNPGLFRDELAVIEEELQDIRNGNSYVPGVRVMSQLVPSVRTQEVNSNAGFGEPALQTNRRLSTGGDYPGEQIGPGPLII